MFVRRILRDLKGTSCDKKFIIKNYLDYVAKEYFKTVLPTKNNADIVLENNMSFNELRQGECLEVQGKYHITNDMLSNIMKEAVLISNTIQKDTYLFCNKKSTTNILRLREVSYNGKDYLMDSLIHKGECRARKDKKIIRPVNIIANKSELYELFVSKEELLNELLKVGISESQVITKQRIVLNYYGETIKLDKIGNEYYIELKCIDKIKCLSNITLEKAEPYFEMINESDPIKYNKPHNRIKEKTII